MFLGIGRILRMPRCRRWQIIFAVLLLNICFVRPQYRSAFMSLVHEGYRLTHHVIYERDVVDDIACAQLCLEHTDRCPSCKSVNLEKEQKNAKKRKCQLNNKTDENVKAEHLVLDAVFDHWKLEQLDYSAGSSPAKCKDTCDSNPCHSDADCIDNDVSYSCKCKPGFFGNGKDCTDFGAMKNSSILGGSLKYFDLMYEWLNRTTNNWTLCWQATQHGWAANEFHDRCNYKIPTVTIIQSGQYICGGYSDVSWHGYDDKTSYEAFLFSFINRDNLQAFKAEIVACFTRAILCLPSYGPGFGCGYDLVVKDHELCAANFGYSFKLPAGYKAGTYASRSLLAGSFNFNATEVEVYYLP